MKKTFMLFCIGMMISLNSWAESSQAEDTAPPVITLEFSNELLQDVLKKISEQSGYEIVLAHTLPVKPVSGKLKNIPLDQALKRVFREVNYSAVWDDNNKKIFVSLYGSIAGPDQSLAGNQASSPPMETAEQNAPVSIPGEHPATVELPVVSGHGVQFIQTTQTANP
jgi:type II secretory pathway component GspD/PulD (secretin)